MNDWELLPEILQLLSVFFSHVEQLFCDTLFQQVVHWKILENIENLWRYFMFLSSYCIHEYLRIEAHLGSKRNNKQNGRTIIGLILLIVHIHRNEEFLQYSLMSTKKNKTSTTSLKFYNNSCSIRSQLSWRTEIRPSPKISCSSGKLSYNGSKFTWQSKVRIF